MSGFNETVSRMSLKDCRKAALMVGEALRASLSCAGSKTGDLRASSSRAGAKTGAAAKSARKKRGPRFSEARAAQNAAAKQLVRRREQERLEEAARVGAARTERQSRRAEAPRVPVVSRDRKRRKVSPSQAAGGQVPSEAPPPSMSVAKFNALPMEPPPPSMVVAMVDDASHPSSISETPTTKPKRAPTMARLPLSPSNGKSQKAPLMPAHGSGDGKENSGHDGGEDAIFDGLEPIVDLHLSPHRAQQACSSREAARAAADLVATGRPASASASTLVPTTGARRPLRQPARPCRGSVPPVRKSR